MSTSVLKALPGKRLNIKGTHLVFSITHDDNGINIPQNKIFKAGNKQW